jgi:hypothetical protein
MFPLIREEQLLDLCTYFMNGLCKQWFVFRLSLCVVTGVAFLVSLLSCISVVLKAHSVTCASLLVLVVPGLQNYRHVATSIQCMCKR